MKNLKILFTIILAALLFTACKKDGTDETKKYPEENPQALYLEKSGFDQEVINFINDAYVEQGFKFKPKVKGKINAVTLKIPDNESNARVTIWNADTKTVIRTITVQSVIAHTEARSDIDPLDIVPTETYIISFNGNDTYSRRRTDFSDAPYPIDAGNISVLSAHYTSGQAQAFPTYTMLNSYWGDVSFVFQQTE